MIHGWKSRFKMKIKDIVNFFSWAMVWLERFGGQSTGAGRGVLTRHQQFLMRRSLVRFATFLILDIPKHAQE